MSRSEVSITSLVDLPILRKDMIRFPISTLAPVISTYSRN